MAIVVGAFLDGEARSWVRLGSDVTTAKVTVMVMRNRSVSASRHRCWCPNFQDDEDEVMPRFTLPWSEQHAASPSIPMNGVLLSLLVVVVIVIARRKHGDRKIRQMRQCNHGQLRRRPTLAPSDRHGGRAVRNLWRSLCLRHRRPSCLLADSNLDDVSTLSVASGVAGRARLQPTRDGMAGH